MNKEQLKDFKVKLLYLKYGGKLLNGKWMSFDQFIRELDLIYKYIDTINRRETTFKNYRYEVFKDDYNKEQEELKEQERLRKINNPTPREFLERLLDQAKTQNNYLREELDYVLSGTQRLEPIYDSDPGIMNKETITHEDGTTSHYFRIYRTRSQGSKQAAYTEINMNENNEVKSIELIRAYGPGRMGAMLSRHILIKGIDQEIATVLNEVYSKKDYFADELDQGTWKKESFERFPRKIKVKRFI